MLEKDFEFVLNNHPDTVGASYLGVSTVGVCIDNQEKFFENDGSYFYVKTKEFSYLTSKLPEINLKTSKNLTINGNIYTIKSVFKENKYITTLYLEQ